MARKGNPLDTLDRFPDMELELITGDTVKLPDATGSNFAVVQFLRGSW